jgi:hypothetical protein
MRCFLLSLLLSLTCSAFADDTRIFAHVGTHHDRGYEGAGVRFGHESGLGLRLGALNAPSKLPAQQWRDLAYAEVDLEGCYGNWCGGLGVAYLTNKTYMNGTEWNFGVHVGYKVAEHWRVVLDHYSHGRALGFAKTRSNRGWNLLGVAYEF